MVEFELDHAYYLVTVFPDESEYGYPVECWSDSYAELVEYHSSGTHLSLAII